MKNIKKVYITLLIGTIALGACKKDLDIQSKSLITASNFWKTEDDAKSGVNGMYFNFRTHTQQNYYLLGGARSAEITAGIQSPLTLANYYNNTLTAQNIDVEWADLYRVVQSTNLVLKYVPSIKFSSMTAANKNAYLAQAYSMRALAYFIMARSWGGVPIVKTPTENTVQTDYIVPRNTIQEVFTFIKADIDSALSLYPDTKNATKVQLSVPSTLALKADVYLWTAKQLGGGNADLTTALAAINAIPAGPGLLPNFKDVFDYNNKGNAEILFAVRYSLTEVTSSLLDNWNSFMFPGPQDFPGVTTAQATAVFGQLGSGAGNAGILRAQPDITRFNFTSSDTRKNATYQTLYDINNNPVSTGLVKYNGTVDGTTRRFVSDIIIYRWADILLMKAEIKNALGQDPTAEMNQVMQRADPSASFTNDTQANNDAVILNERLKELAFEGKAWWDLVRFGKTGNVPSMTGSKPILFPISANTINYNPKVTQNPGY